MPAGVRDLSFWVTRDTELDWDFLFVEAHAVGTGDWTTLPDPNGHTSRDTGFVLPVLARAAPVPRALPDRERRRDLRSLPARRASGMPSAGPATAGSTGASTSERTPARRSRCRSPTRATTSSRLRASSSTTSSSLPAPARRRSRTTATRWTDGPCRARRRAARRTPTTGSSAPRRTRRRHSASRSTRRLRSQPEIVEFLENRFGDYPFSAGGALVDDVAGLGFALENQTRPIYAIEWFFDPLEAEGVFVHEIAHQWYGDSLALALWQHIWLNEGFATYAEWLWFEEKHGVSAQEILRRVLLRNSGGRPVLAGRRRRPGT